LPVRRARAQQQPMLVVGYLAPSTPEMTANQVKAFRKGLDETGYIEGRNVAVEYPGGTMTAAGWRNWRPSLSSGGSASLSREA
jgi:hypothetical protein